MHLANRSPAGQCCSIISSMRKEATVCGVFKNLQKLYSRSYIQNFSQIIVNVYLLIVKAINERKISAVNQFNLVTL